MSSPTAAGVGQAVPPTPSSSPSGRQTRFNCTIRPSIHLSTPLLLLIACLVLSLSSFPQVALSQHAPALQNFIFYQLPTSRRPVAHSTLDQGELVQSRLRTRRSVQPLQTLGSFQSRVRPTREEEEERAGGRVYECTSLDGPECSFVRGGQSNEIIIKLLQNFVAQQAGEGKDEEQQQQDAVEQSSSSQHQTSGELSVTDEGSSGDSLASTYDAAMAGALRTQSQETAAASQYSGDDQLVVTDETTDASQTDLEEQPPLTDEERAYQQELSTLSLSQLIMQRALERDGQAADEFGEMDGDNFEYQLMTVGDDGVEREMTEAEREELRQQLLNGEVDIEMEDEEDEQYWEEDGLEYNTTSGEYEYGDDEELVANGVH